MNRIILIGNGFDLAHGLKTSYKDFIDDYLTNKVNSIVQDGNYIHFHEGYTAVRNNPTIYKDEDIIIVWREPMGLSNNYSIVPKIIQSFFNTENIKINISYNNAFLEKIMTAYYDKKWVDIEDDYYKELKNCIKEANKIDKLNQDFKQIKNELKIYLGKVNDELMIYKIDFPITRIMAKIYANSEQINSILFLNFNYTTTHKFYSGEYNQDRYYSINPNHVGKIKRESIQIHGSLKEANNNPIIFGYGDEIGKEYLEIENLNDNRFLENIKSIKYLETRNYKKLDNFINSDKYQILLPLTPSYFEAELTK